jgi:hypothetical protein
MPLGKHVASGVASGVVSVRGQGTVGTVAAPKMGSRDSKRGIGDD